MLEGGQTGNLFILVKGPGGPHNKIMRVALISLILCTGLAAESVYEFQGPRRSPQYSGRTTARTSHRKAQSAPTWSPSPTAALASTPRVNQRPAPAHLSSWGGTLIQTEGSGWFITSNGPLPLRSVVCIGRGDRYLGQAQVVTSAENSAQIEPMGGAAFEAGDWVSLVSIPTPPTAPAFSGYATSYRPTYHPTSTNADPTYQRWLRQGFTLGRVSYPACNRGYSLRSVRSSRW